MKKRVFSVRLPESLIHRVRLAALHARQSYEEWARQAFLLALNAKGNPKKDK